MKREIGMDDCAGVGIVGFGVHRRDQAVPGMILSLIGRGEAIDSRGRFSQTLEQAMKPS